MRKYIIGGFLILFSILLTLNILQSSYKVYSVTEIIEKNITGNVVLFGNVSKINFTDSGYRIILSDGNYTILVIYNGSLPSTPNNTVAFVEGYYDGKRVVASRVLLKCPSKYDVKIEENVRR